MAKLLRTGWIAALALMCCALGDAASAAQSADTKSHSTAEADLDVLANFIFPGAPVVQFAIGSCHQALQEIASKKQSILDAEKVMPGISATMVDAATSYCTEHMPALVDAVHQRVKSDWSTSSTPAQRAMLAKHMRPIVDEVVKIRSEFHPGETVAAVADRLPQVGPAQDAELKKMESEIIKEPGGLELLKRVGEYQTETNARQEADIDVPVVQVLKQSLHEAYLAGNSFAAQRLLISAES